LDRYAWIDMHCDTLLRGNREGADSFWDGPGHQSLKQLASSGQMAQFFAVFFPPCLDARDQAGLRRAFPSLEGMTEDTAYFLALRGILLDQLSAHPEAAALALSPAEIRRNAEKGLASAVLTIEDGRLIDGDLSRVAWLHEMGVRAIGLTWHHPNCLGYPNHPDPAVNSRGSPPSGGKRSRR